MLLLNSALMVFAFFSAVALSSGIIATLCLAIAVLVINIGEWKTRLVLLPRFTSLPMPAPKPHRYRSLPSRFKKQLAATVGCGRTESRPGAQCDAVGAER
jgi:hypothetical protein